jgi:hypothetical protein
MVKACMGVDEGTRTGDPANYVTTHTRNQLSILHGHLARRVVHSLPSFPTTARNGMHRRGRFFLAPVIIPLSEGRPGRKSTNPVC